MTENEYLPKLHQEILNVLDQIVVICQKHKLKYYLIGGTLLGAVRHHGFIPWDDDLDIVMPRADFNSFVNKYASELPVPYSLRWITTDKNYYQVFAKVCNDNTLFCENLGNGKTTDTGIFVDIFPLDEVKGKTLSVHCRKWMVLRTNILMCAKASGSFNHIIQSMVSKILSIQQLHKFATSLMSRTNDKGYSYYANFGSQYAIDKQTHLIESFGEGALLDFENRKYCVPVEYEKVLTSIFGNKYMELPPVEKRRTHYPAKVLFSDGTKLEFDEPKKRLKVTDQ